jgi:hypothetical protein
MQETSNHRVTLNESKIKMNQRNFEMIFQKFLLFIIFLFIKNKSKTKTKKKKRKYFIIYTNK